MASPPTDRAIVTTGSFSSSVCAIALSGPDKTAWVATVDEIAQISVPVSQQLQVADKRVFQFGDGGVVKTTSQTAANSSIRGAEHCNDFGGPLVPFTTNPTAADIGTPQLVCGLTYFDVDELAISVPSGFSFLANMSEKDKLVVGDVVQFGLAKGITVGGITVPGVSVAKNVGSDPSGCPRFGMK